LRNANQSGGHDFPLLERNGRLRARVHRLVNVAKLEGCQKKRCALTHKARPALIGLFETGGDAFFQKPRLKDHEAAFRLFG
jgi:hypothetical protein